MSISGFDIRDTSSYDPYIYMKGTLRKLIDENMDLSSISELLIRICNTNIPKDINPIVMDNLSEKDLLEYIILRIKTINVEDRSLLLSEASKIIKKHYEDYRNFEDYEQLDNLIRLYYFGKCLDFSDDFIRTIQAKIKEINQKPRDAIQKKTLGTNTLRYIADTQERFEENQDEVTIIKQIFKSKFTEDQQRIIQNGSINEKLYEINTYLKTVDDLDVYWELYVLLEFLQEYITTKDSIR